MAEDDPITKTSVSLRESLKWRFKQTAAARRMNERQALEEALEIWIGENSIQHLQQFEALDTLARILRSHDDPARDMILPLLTNWAKAHAHTEETAPESVGNRPKIARSR